MGRVWIVDAALGFRDRFASRLSNASWDAAVAHAEGGADQKWRHVAAQFLRGRAAAAL